MEDKLEVLPGAPLQGEISFPGDKSLSHRAALFASLADGQSHIENFLVAGVTRAMLNALDGLGVHYELNGSTLVVDGKGLRGYRYSNQALNCGNSATTMRLLAGAVAASGAEAVLDGSEGLRRRPMDRIVVPLLKMGLQITAVDGKYAPLWINPVQESAADRQLKALDYILPVSSAQVKSCLLLAALSADGETTLIEPGPSRDHTERLLRGMGVEIFQDRLTDMHSGINQFRIILVPPATGKLRPLHLKLPGDFSSAAFLLVAGLITPGSEILLRNVGLNPTRTGLLDALRAMGGDIELSDVQDRYGEPVGDITVRHSNLSGTQVDGPLVVRMIDEFPVFAVAAAFADGVTTVREAEELRYKESDRIKAVCAQLRAIGTAVEEKPDGFILQGGERPSGGDVQSYGDHRLAMAMGIAGLAAQASIKISGAGIIHESFPEFSNVLQQLGANIN